MPNRIVIAVVALLALAVAALYVVFTRADAERRPLDQAVRENVAGNFVDLSDGKTHYDVAGPENGSPVVLVHGFSVPYYIWQPTFDTLSRAGFRVARYDLYGRGYSDRPDTNYDGRLFERQLDELIDALDLAGPVDLIGLSMGGAIVMRYAAARPDRIRRIVLIDPVYAARPPPRLPAFIGEYLLGVTLIPSLPESQYADFVRPENYPDWADRYRVQMQFDGFRRAIVSTIYHFMAEDHLAGFRKVQQHDVPVMLIWGEQDRTLDIAGADTVRNVLDVEFLPVADAGHLPHIEQADIVNPAIVDFLER